jgi:cyanophycin synthetase
MASVWDIPAPVTRSFVPFPKRWTVLTGFGFGLREPALVGLMRGSLPERYDAGELDRLMARLTGEQVPTDIDGGTDLARLVARAMFWTGALQRHARLPVFGRAFVRAEPRGDDGEERLLAAVPFYDPGASAIVFRWMETALNGFLEKGQFFDGRADDAQAQWAELRAALNKFSPPGQNTYKYLRDAHKQNIPARQFLPGIHCIGVGARSRWLKSSFTDRTGLLASRIAGDKQLTAMVLRRAGLPAPTHALVRSAEEAVSVAHKLGYPVVVKPSDRQQGTGVAANLKDDAAVTAAFAEALKSSQNILVEKHFEGIDHRMVVLDGRLLRVKARMPGGVVGDGESTIARLVELRKQAPDSLRRAHERGRQLLDLDEEALSLLAENGLTPNDIPAEDQYVRLRRRGNVSAGGVGITVEMKDIHPDNIRMAERAASALRLDFGGLDAIFPDIKKSWMETGALICEVNPQPQAGAVLEEILGGDGRIPLILVVGAPDCVDRKELQAKVSQHGALGFASRDGAWLGDERLAAGQPDSLTAGQILLDDPRTEAAVIVMSAADTARKGLPADQFNALIFDSPDNWDEDDRKSVANMLDVALPHSLKTLSVQTDQPPTGWGQAEKRQWQVRAESVQRLCEETIASALSAGKVEKGDAA